MAVALRRTVPTLVASAATVTISMLCLLAAQSASLHGFGPVGAVSIASALIAEITFLPAILLVAGRKVFWPWIPRNGDPGGEESRVWAGIGARIARHPAPVTVVTVLLLGAACAGLGTLYTNGNPADDIKGDPGSVVGARLLAEHYPAGDLAPLVLLAPPGRAGAAAAAAHATPSVAAVTPGTPVEGTVRGLGVTGGVITAAGIIMTACIGDIATLPAVSTAQVASGIAIGILLDTLLVRTVLVPAGLLTIGERVWWPSRPQTARPERSSINA